MLFEIWWYSEACLCEIAWFLFQEEKLHFLPLFSLLGKLIKKGFGLNELLNIHNSAKVVNVKEPEAGMWTVKVLLFPSLFAILFLSWRAFWSI